MTAARALAEAALEVARERAEILGRARRARMRGDDGEALRCLDVLCGLAEPEDEEEARPQ